MRASCKAVANIKIETSVLDNDVLSSNVLLFFSNMNSALWSSHNLSDFAFIVARFHLNSSLFINLIYTTKALWSILLRLIVNNLHRKGLRF